MLGNTVRLNRSLYGLKQSGQQWAGLLVGAVVEYGMEQCRTEPCDFRMHVDGKVDIVVAFHVDETALAGSDGNCKYIHAAWVVKYPTSNLAELTWCTGCAFIATGNWERGTLKSTQKAFIEDNCKSIWCELHVCHSRDPRFGTKSEGGW